MGKFSKRAKIVVAGSVVLATVGGGVAFAYWSTSGSGAGTAGTSAGTSSLVVSQDAFTGNLAPGAAPVAITGTVKNTANNSAYVNTVKVSIASVTQAAGASGTCDATDYTLPVNTATVATDLAAGQSVAFSGPTLAFVDKSTNQDGCKGATVNLSYTTN